MKEKMKVRVNMKRRKKRRMALFMVFVMLLAGIAAPDAVQAENSTQESNKVLTYTKDGETITAWIDENREIWVQGEKKKRGIGSTYDEIAFDKNGTIWMICYNSIFLSGWNYYIQYNEIGLWWVHPNKKSEDIESFVFDENNEYVIAFKTVTGNIYPLYTYEEIEEKTKIHRREEDSTPSPSPTPVPTVKTPSPTPKVSIPTSTTNPNPKAAAVGVSITADKTNNITSILEDGKLLSSFKLKAGTLTWNTKTEKGKVKNVKYAGYIKKSKNLVYITKKGNAYIISSKNGKKKCIVKKNARKLVMKEGFATKIKKKSGSVNITKK